MSKELCSIANCNGIVVARNLCGYHYGKARRAEMPSRPRNKPRMHPNSLAVAESWRKGEKPPHPAEHIPGFAEFISSKATADRDEIVRKLQEEARRDPVRFPGGVVPWSMIPADPHPQHEIVRLTRVPGGRGIRRS